MVDQDFEGIRMKEGGARMGAWVGGKGGDGEEMSVKVLYILKGSSRSCSPQ